MKTIAGLFGIQYDIRVAFEGVGLYGNESETGSMRVSGLRNREDLEQLRMHRALFSNGVSAGCTSDRVLGR